MVEAVVLILFFGLLSVIAYLLMHVDAREKAISYVNSERGSEKEARKKMIVARLREGKRLTNEDVQRLFEVSDSTATRYFDELQEEGRVEQVGETGRGVYYRVTRP